MLYLKRFIKNESRRVYLRVIQGGNGMKLQLKKSKITDWWVARNNHKMAFVNIFSNEPLENLLIVGYYLDKRDKILATSTNYVVRITKEGVITAQGSFYPFEEAHELYLQFLINANKKNTLIASNWEIRDNSSPMILVADIISNSGVKEDVLFDFIPDRKTDVTFSGYSKELSSNIVITTFARRNVCIILDIPQSVMTDIYNSSIALSDESNERIVKVQKIFNEKANRSYISVKVN